MLAFDGLCVCRKAAQSRSPTANLMREMLLIGGTAPIGPWSNAERVGLQLGQNGWLGDDSDIRREWTDCASAYSRAGTPWTSASVRR